MTEEISVRSHVSQSRFWWSLYVSETINVVHKDSQVFCAARGPGICQRRAFDTHAISYQNITTQRKNKQIGSFVKDGKNWRGL